MSFCFAKVTPPLFEFAYFAHLLIWMGTLFPSVLACPQLSHLPFWCLLDSLNLPLKSRASLSGPRLFLPLKFEEDRDLSHLMYKCLVLYEFANRASSIGSGPLLWVWFLHIWAWLLCFPRGEAHLYWLRTVQILCTVLAKHLIPTMDMSSSGSARAISPSWSTKVSVSKKKSSNFCVSLILRDRSFCRSMIFLDELPEEYLILRAFHTSYGSLNVLTYWCKEWWIERLIIEQAHCLCLRSFSYASSSILNFEKRHIPSIRNIFSKMKFRVPMMNEFDWSMNSIMCDCLIPPCEDLK